MTVLFSGQLCLFEFKLVELTSADHALEQIKDMGCVDRCRARGDPIHLSGVACSKTSRNIVGFEVETRPISNGFGRSAA
ncbi:MAG: hypothetical protein C0445_13525 [Polaromonas sp.]|nr:hypothetical protein [Polaromonas sp.]